MLKILVSQKIKAKRGRPGVYCDRGTDLASSAIYSSSI